MDGDVCYTTCACQSCGGNIEFDTAGIGQTVVCPHCGVETLLSNASHPVIEVPLAGGLENLVRKPWLRRFIFAVVTGLALVIFAIAIIHFKTRHPEIQTESSAQKSASIEMLSQTNVPKANTSGPSPRQISGSDSFTNDAGVWNYEIVSNVVSLVKYTGTDVDLTIPATFRDLPVANIDNYAFSNCTTLRSVNIPEGVESLHQGIFNGCANLKHVSIPSTATDIVDTTFDETQRLTAINVASNNPIFASFGGVMFEKQLSFGAYGELARLLHKGCPQCDELPKLAYPALPFYCTGISDNKYLHLTVNGQTLILTVGHDYGDSEPVLDFQAKFNRNEIPEFETMLCKFLEWDAISKANNLVTPGITKTVPCGIRNVACFFHANEHLLTNDPQPYSLSHSGIASEDVPTILQLLLNTDAIVSDWKKGKDGAQHSAKDAQNRANTENNLFK